MTYAATVKHLKACALAAGAASFWFGPQTNQNINYDAAFPQAHLFLMPAPLVGENVAYQCTLCFYGKDAQENAANLLPDAPAPTAEEVGQSLAIQGAMDQLTQRFVFHLRDAEQFDVSERIERTPVLRKGSGIGTGFVVQLTLTAPADFLC